MRKSDMLRSLVKKFKSQNLEDGGGQEVHDSLPPAGTPPPLKVPRLGTVSTRQQLSGTQHASQHHIIHTGRNTPTQGQFTHTQSGTTGSSEQLDSGTESDEHEQSRGAKAETVSVASVGVSQTSDYYASQQSLSLASGSFRSASPTALSQGSDIDTNSRDSMGCESGIVINRGSGSGHSSDTDQPGTTPTQRLYAQHQANMTVNRLLLGKQEDVMANAAYLTRQHLRHCRQQQQQRSLSQHSSSAHSGSGAFQPVDSVKRKWVDADVNAGVKADCCEQYSNGAHGNAIQMMKAVVVNMDMKHYGQQQPVAALPKLTFAQIDEVRRETLTAVRRMPVRLVIGSPAGAALAGAASANHGAWSPSLTLPHTSNNQHNSKLLNYDLTDEIDELSLEKRANFAFSSCATTRDGNTSGKQTRDGATVTTGRRTGGAHRPSLDFNKMRERMVKPGHGSRRHDGFRTNKANNKGWSGVLPSKSCAQTDCLFRPVDVSSDQSSSSPYHNMESDKPIDHTLHEPPATTSNA